MDNRKLTIPNIARIICTVAVIAMVLVAICIYHASVTGLAIFVAYMLFYIQLPGALLLQPMKLDRQPLSTKLLISLLIGWFLIVAEYFVSDLIGSKILLYCLGPIASLCYVYLSIKKKKSKQAFALKSSFNKIPVALFVSFVLMLLYMLLRTQYTYMAPDFATLITPGTDKSYQMGLINELARDYPINNPWVSGRIVHYHIFSQILFAVPASLFGLTSDFLIFSCGPYLNAYLLCLSFYSLFMHYCKKKENAGMYTLSIVLSNMFIGYSITNSYLFRIIFVNDNYGGYGLAAALAWLVLIKICTEERTERSTSLYRFIIIAAILILATGIKAPIGLLLIGGLIGSWILGLILQKNNLKSITPVAVLTIIFFVLYKLLLGSSGSSDSNGKSIFGFAKLNNICFWKNDLIDTLTAHSVSPLIRLAIVMSLFLIVFFSAFLIPFIIGYIREFVLIVSKKKDYDIAAVTVYAVTLLGFVMSMILTYSGHSQIYFGVILVGTVPLVVFRFWEDISMGESTAWMECLCKISKAVFIVVIAVSSILFALDNIKAYKQAVSYLTSSRTMSYSAMNENEYDAMEWISENTPEDSLFATNVYGTRNPEKYNIRNRWDNTHFMYAAYSDRRFYIEGSGFSLSESEIGIRVDMIETNSKLYDSSNTARGQLAKELGIDYVVVTKNRGDVEDLSNNDYEKCYTNKTIDIYKIS